MKYGLLFLILLSCFSCSKIQPEKNEININPQASKATKMVVYHMGTESCGVHSCNLDKYLSEKYENQELHLPDLESYRKRFQMLLNMYPKTQELLKSQSFRTFALDINKDFFGCEGNIYKCQGTMPYGYDETNYLFYIFIPKLIADEFILAKGGDESDAETIVQTIKRKDFVSHEEKETKIVIYKDRIKKTVSAMDFSRIDRTRIVDDLAYFQEIVLNPISGIHDNIMKEFPSIDIDWEEGDQAERISEFTRNEFYRAIQTLGISKEKFISNVVTIHGLGNSDINSSMISKLHERIKLMNKKYGLDTKIPLDRYYRNDELSVFSAENKDSFLANVSNGRNSEFDADALYIRHLIFLMFNLGHEEKFYNLPDRLKKENFEEKFLLTNIFKYSKYIKYDNNY